ncbi:hypothetical protein [Kitasatospora sp. P5_F3]
MTWTQAYLATIPALWVAGVFVIAICRAAALGDQEAEHDRTDAPSTDH